MAGGAVDGRVNCRSVIHRPGCSAVYTEKVQIAVGAVALGAAGGNLDRIILIPQDVAALWRAFGRMNMGMESVFDF